MRERISRCGGGSIAKRKSFLFASERERECFNRIVPTRGQRSHEQKRKKKLIFTHTLFPKHRHHHHHHHHAPSTPDQSLSLHVALDQWRLCSHAFVRFWWDSIVLLFWNVDDDAQISVVYVVPETERILRTPSV